MKSNSVFGIDQDEAVGIAQIIDRHDQPMTTTAHRRELAANLIDLLDEDTKETALDLARLLRRACERKGIYQRPEKVHRPGMAGVGAHTRRISRGQ